MCYCLFLPLTFPECGTISAFIALVLQLQEYFTWNHKDGIIFSFHEKPEAVFRGLINMPAYSQRIKRRKGPWLPRSPFVPERCSHPLAQESVCALSGIIKVGRFQSKSQKSLPGCFPLLFGLS